MATTETRVREQGVIIEGRRYYVARMNCLWPCDACMAPLAMGCTVYSTYGDHLVCLACGNRLGSCTDADTQAGGDT